MTGQVPHALRAAHADLSAELATGIGEFNANLCVYNSQAICDAAERFVDAFHRIPGGEAELLRRSKYVAKQCGPGTEYRRLMDVAFACLKNAKTRPVGASASPARNSINSLKPVSDPQYAEELAILIETLKSAMRAETPIGVAGVIPARCKRAFLVWLAEMKRIDMEAKHVEADGCLYLLSVYQAWDPSATELDEIIETLLLKSIGGTHLQGMRAAADSLIAAVDENDLGINGVSAPSASPVKAGTTVGVANPKSSVAQSTSEKKTKRSTTKGEAREKLIAALTHHHDYQNGSCLNTESINNNELARNAGVSRSTASQFFQREFGGSEKKGGHTNYKIICRDPARLAESLKVLNGEFSPDELFGRNPPGEQQPGDEE
ncbi:hypothetical protein Pan258_57830 [Symmachiella dynata]|uniref:hypothetical protein n=1 Tax=Symmachiella dynata TaxID=2527995 RepID=UPI00118A7527|nr:hypothetical protein [Symmachiella dynata]QDT51691.1 hypothetical protein Pan258_57830 [Symmachiella dynata]